MMGQFAAKLGDRIIATDIHIVMVPTPVGKEVPTPLPHPFTGVIGGNLSTNVNIMGRPAATVGSMAVNLPPHLPMPPGTSFQIPPTNQGTIQMGSPSVRINGKMAARNGDIAQTCNDPAELPVGTVIAFGTVLIG
jgi:uncharacterized Zn-binding protein involved in type VI secretion